MGIYNRYGRLRVTTVLTIVIGVFLLMGVCPAHAKDQFVMGIPGVPYTFHPWDMAQNNSPNHAQFYNRLIVLDKQLKPHAEIATCRTVSYCLETTYSILIVDLRDRSASACPAPRHPP